MSRTRRWVFTRVGSGMLIHGSVLNFLCYFCLNSIMNQIFEMISLFESLNQNFIRVVPPLYLESLNSESVITNHEWSTNHHEPLTIHHSPLAKVKRNTEILEWSSDWRFPEKGLQSIRGNHEWHPDKWNSLMKEWKFAKAMGTSPLPPMAMNRREATVWVEYQFCQLITTRKSRGENDISKEGIWIRTTDVNRLKPSFSRPRLFGWGGAKTTQRAPRNDAKSPYSFLSVSDLRWNLKAIGNRSRLPGKPKNLTSFWNNHHPN